MRSEFGDTRKAALSSLAKSCPELAHLEAMELADDSQPDVRIKAVEILSELGIGNSAPFEHALDDTDVWVQLSAAKSLMKHFPESLSQETVQSLVSNFQFQLQLAHTPRDTTRYLEAIRELSPSVAFDTATRLLKDNRKRASESVRDAIEEFLSTTKTDSHGDGTGP